MVRHHNERTATGTPENASRSSLGLRNPNLLTPSPRPPIPPNICYTSLQQGAQ